MDRNEALGRYLAGWFAGAVPALAMITLLWLYPGPATPFGIVALGAYGLSFPVMVRRLAIPRTTTFVGFLLVAGVAFAVVSILTGWGNGLTDEAFTTPRFAAFLLSGHDPYTTPLTFAYVAYGQHFVSSSFYVYLPLLMFLQVPGLPYKWFSLGCWVVLVLLVRRRFDVAVVLAQPYVMLIGENGYNDLVVLLLLTVGFVGWGGRRQKWAEWLSLGCKQFANVFVLAYYAVRRDVRNLVLTAAVSVVFVLPFLLWGGSAALCPTLVANRPAFCPHTGGVQLLANYPVWPVWVEAVFYLPALAAVRAWWTRRSPGGRSPTDVRRTERLPSLTIVAAASIVSGLGVYVVTEALVGAGGVRLVLATGAAAVAAVAWNWAWGGPWSYERAKGADRASALRAFAVATLLWIAVTLAVAVPWSTVGGGTVAGEAVGLTLGAAVGYGWTVARRLAAPLESPSEAPGTLEKAAPVDAG